MTAQGLTANKWLQHGFVLLMIGAIFGVYAWQVTVAFTAFPGGLTDSRFNNSVLEHLFLWSDGRAEDLWRPDFFYPYPDVLTFSDNHFGSGALYATFRHFGLGREDAYTCWYLLGTLTSFAATYYALQKFGFSPLAAAMGGIVFAFAGTMLFRTEHSQLLYRFATPLAWLYAWRFLDSARLKHLGLTAFFVAWQFLCAIYLGVFLVLFFMGAVLGLLMFRTTRAQLVSLLPRVLKQRPGLTDWAFLVLGLALSLVAAYVLARYALAAHEYGFARHPSIILAQQPLPGSYLVLDYSPYYHAMGQWVKDDFLRHEKQMFVGAGAILLMLAALLPVERGQAWRRPASVLLVALVFLVLITLRFPGGFSLYWPFAHAPGFSSIRAVGRVIEVMLLPVAFIAAMGFTKLYVSLNRLVPALGIGVAILFGAGFFMEVRTLHYHTTPRDQLESRQEAIRALVPEDLPEDAVLVYRERKDPQPYVMTDVDAIVLAQQVGRPVLNGYSGNFPPGYHALRTCNDILAPVAGAAFYTGMSPDEMDAFLDRLVLIDFPDCIKVEREGQGFAFSDPAETVTTQPIPVDLPARITLRVEGLELRETGIGLTMSVSNSGEASLPGNFGAGAHNLRFSWRFVREEEDMPRGLNWDTRAQLMSSAQPGKTIQQTFLIQPPAEPGLYQVQVSMVQEQVMWLHDHGLEIAGADTWIAVAADGAIRLVMPEELELPAAAE